MLDEYIKGDLVSHRKYHWVMAYDSWKVCSLLPCRARGQLDTRAVAVTHRFIHKFKIAWMLGQTQMVFHRIGNQSIFMHCKTCSLLSNLESNYQTIPIEKSLKRDETRTIIKVLKMMVPLGITNCPTRLLLFIDLL